MTVLPDLLLAISGLLNFRNSCLSLEKWKPQTKGLISTGHTETTVDSRKVSPSVRVTLQTPGRLRLC